MPQTLTGWRALTTVPVMFLRARWLAASLFGFAAPGLMTDVRGASSPALKRLSLEELMNVEVSTVSRKAELLWTAPGALDVIGDDDIRRSGVTNIPDALRLAAGVHVGQANAREWAIGMRGFNVNASNKLNVQLDGRSLFTPFFSGVLWDAQDTMIEDIARIEVMRGPAGASWGAFALNGFVQILTKPAWETQGLLASVATGTENPLLFSARYGGKLSDTTFYRVYAKYNQYKWTYTRNTDRRAAPDTDFLQTGFRADTRGAGGSVLTLQGDAYTNKGTPKDRPQNEVSGANLTAHWFRPLALNADVRGTVYYDYTEKAFVDPFHETRHTFSGSLKYHVATRGHDIQVGADALFSRDDVRGGIIYLDPAERDYHNLSIFAQDTIALVPGRWNVTAGVQGLYTNFSGFDFQPTLRTAWMPQSRTTIWSALSRAVRTPVRIDEDLTAKFDTLLAFQGNKNLKSETVLSWELGVRHKFNERLAVAVTGFLNRYDNVRSYESATSTFRAFPWTFKNTTNVDTSGFEIVGLGQPAARVYVKASYRYLDFSLTKDPGSGDFQNGFYEANDPRHLANVTTRIDLPRRVEVDVTVRYASSLPNPPMEGFTTMDARIGWNVTDRLDVSLIGRNLLDARHPEFTTANHPNDEVARSLTLRTTWRY